VLFTFIQRKQIAEFNQQDNNNSKYNSNRQTYIHSGKEAIIYFMVLRSQIQGVVT